MRFAAVIILFINLPAFAQEADTSSYFSEGFQIQYGFIIPHSEKIEAVSGTNPIGFEINLNRFNTSYKSWKVFNAFRITGFQLGYFNFQNKMLGSAFVATAFTEPVIAHGKRCLFSVRGGAGLSYHTRLYDSIENPLNNFFSTRISFPLYVNARFSYRMNRSTLFTFSGFYNHISNGGVKQPNIGMNFPTLSLGIQYFPKQIPVLNRGFTSAMKLKPGLSFLVQGLSGYRVVDKTEFYPEKGTFAFGLHMRTSKQLKPYYALNAGAEFIVDGAIKEMIKRKNLDIDHKRLALTAGHDFLFGNAVFTQYFGFYVYSPYKARNKVYQKYELAYKLNPKFLFGVYLKAHAYVAEIMGLNISYIL